MSSTYLNRGSNPAPRPLPERRFKPDDRFFRDRELKRQDRARYRQTHRLHGWTCPYCEHEQILEYATEHRPPGAALPTLPRWMLTGIIETRCDNVARDADGAVVGRCEGLARLVISQAAGFEHAAAWETWTQARWRHAKAADARERAQDGIYGGVAAWERNLGLPVPRFDLPPPPFAKYDHSADITPVERLEAPRSPMSTVTLWLPSGHLRVSVATDYPEGKRQWVEMSIPLPFQPDLRRDLLALLPPEKRAEYDENDKPVYYKSPYGTTPYCWTGKLTASVAPEPEEEEIPPPSQTRPLDDDLDEEADAAEWAAIQAHMADSTPPPSHEETVAETLARITTEQAQRGVTFLGTEQLLRPAPTADTDTDTDQGLDADDDTIDDDDATDESLLDAVSVEFFDNDEEPSAELEVA